MPTYHYECKECSHRFDAIRTMAERKTANCPECYWGVGEQKLTPVRIDYYNMGLDPVGNPTAGDKWVKMQESKGTKPRG